MARAVTLRMVFVYIALREIKTTKHAARLHLHGYFEDDNLNARITAKMVVRRWKNNTCVNPALFIVCRADRTDHYTYYNHSASGLVHILRFADGS